MKKLISSSIKNLLFDLGGVIINIEPIRVAKQFSVLSGKDLSFIRQQIEERRVFHNYEIGKWSDAEFRNSINHMLELSLTDQQIDDIWNSMLLDIPKERIDLLLSLRKQYNLYLLSNTNQIHINAVNAILHQTCGVPVLEDLFDKTYYSHLIHLYKPAADCYTYVLQDSTLLPEETLFIDDNEDNIRGAKQLGIQTVHLQSPATILDIFQ